MSKVILGMPGPWADDNHEASDHYTTKIGGLPDWPIPNIVSKSDLLKCCACGSHLCLIAQIYAPVSNKILTTEERVIYIFGCATPRCGSPPVSWRAFRIQKSVDSKESEALVPKVGALPEPSSSVLNNDSQKDPWAFDDEDDEIDLEELSRQFTEAASLSSQAKKQNGGNQPKTTKTTSPITQTTRMVDEKTPVLPCFYLYTQEEVFSKDFASVCSSYCSLSIKENQANDDNAQEEIWEAENYEYDRALNADRTYLKFKKRIDAYPEQCFRYSLSGNPLLANKELADPGRCTLCGESREYELQLMPPLLYFLQEATKTFSLENWSWMTLIVFTCSQACSKSSNQDELFNDGWILSEEAVVVQHE